MAAVVPEPVRAGIAGLIKPVCLLLAQVICFRDQKQNTINPRVSCSGRPSGSHAKKLGWAPQPQAQPWAPSPPSHNRGPGRGWRGKDSLQQGPLGQLRAQGPVGRQAPQALCICIDRPQLPLPSLSETTQWESSRM